MHVDHCPTRLQLAHRLAHCRDQALRPAIQHRNLLPRDSVRFEDLRGHRATHNLVDASRRLYLLYVINRFD